MTKIILKTVWREFIYGGHLQSLGASSIVFISGVLLKIQITWDVLVMAYLLFYPLYLFNRFKEMKIDMLTNPERTKYLQTYLRFMPLILWLVIILLTAGLVYFSNPWAVLFGLLLLSFGLLYTTVFKRVTKKIALFKNLYVAAFFALLVLFAVIYYGQPLNLRALVPVLILMAFVYAKSLMMQIFLDIKDTATDKREKLLTFSAIFGETKTLHILKIISILATAPILVVFSLYYHIFSKSILMLLLIIPFNFYCFNQARQKKYFSFILSSGEFILWSILILIGETIL